MKKVTINFEFSDIKDLRLKGVGKVLERTVHIELKDGGLIELTGPKGVKLYKQLCRNFPGEHLD